MEYFGDRATILDIFLLHQKFNDATPLSGVLGDGFLYEHSMIFSRVRDFVINSGVVYAEENSSFNKNYSTAPLLYISEIYKQRQIPWKNNARAYEHLSASYDLSIHFSGQTDNPITHESLHLIVNDFFGGSCPDFRDLSRTAAENLTVQLLAGEAAASCFELLVSCENASNAYAAMVRYNLYLNNSLNRYVQLAHLQNEFGRKKIFEHLYLSYFFSNYQFGEKHPTDEVRLAIYNYVNFANLTVYHRRLLNQLMDEAYMISRMFATNTTSAYFKMIGGPENLKDLYSFDIQKMVFKDRVLDPLIDYLFRSLLDDK